MSKICYNYTWGLTKGKPNPKAKKKRAPWICPRCGKAELIKFKLQEPCWKEGASFYMYVCPERCGFTQKAIVTIRPARKPFLKV